MARLIVACPNCGAPNAATVAACVQCGANLKPEATTVSAPPGVIANDTQSNAPDYQTEAAPMPPSYARFQTPDYGASSHKKDSKVSLASLGSQAIFYVGCAILIIIPLLVIGFGPLRAMLARVFQH